MAKTRKRRRSLQMVGENRPLNDLPESHIARRTVIAHENCCRECVGQEVAWPGHGEDAFDQRWHSDLLQREFSFSSFAYCFISFNLVMDEWIAHPPQVTKAEVDGLSHLPLLQALVDECEAAARQDENVRVQRCVSQVREFLALWEESIRLRISEDGLGFPTARELEKGRDEWKDRLLAK